MVLWRWWGRRAEPRYGILGLEACSVQPISRRAISDWYSWTMVLHQSELLLVIGILLQRMRGSSTKNPISNTFFHLSCYQALVQSEAAGKGGMGGGERGRGGLGGGIGER